MEFEDQTPSNPASGDALPRRLLYSGVTCVMALAAIECLDGKKIRLPGANITP
jgi:hypothetical protein